MAYYTYILLSLQDNRFYTGITNNISRRLNEHNVGSKNTPSTLNRGPFRLIHLEEHESRGKAREREKFWKSGVGRELRSKIMNTMGE